MVLALPCVSWQGPPIYRPNDLSALSPKTRTLMSLLEQKEPQVVTAMPTRNVVLTDNQAEFVEYRVSS